MGSINRPKAAEWQAHLTRILEAQGLARCDRFPNDFQHIRFTGKPCPQCQLEAVRSVMQKNTKRSSTTGETFKSGERSRYQVAPPSFPPKRSSTNYEFTGFKILLGIVLLVILFVFIFESDSESSGSSRPATDSRPTPTATAPTAISVAIPRSRSWGTDTATLIKGINDGAITVYSFRAQQVGSLPPTAILNGGAFLSETVIRGIQDQNIWWPTGNRLFIRLYNPSGVDISTVYFELSTTSCDATHGRKILLKLSLSTPLRATTHAIFAGNLPFDYASVIGIGVRCGTVVAASHRDNPTQTSSVKGPDDSTPRAEMSIATIQYHLRRLGFDPGPVDGLPGPRTQRAIQAFQISRGLIGDGVITPGLERELRSASAALDSSKPSSGRPSSVSYVSVYRTSGGGAGWSAGRSSQREADVAALDSCRQYSGDPYGCVKWFGGQGECIAIARASRGVLGGAWGSPEGPVIDLALKNCRGNGGRGCVLAGSLCR